MPKDEDMSSDTQYQVTHHVFVRVQQTAEFGRFGDGQAAGLADLGVQRNVHHVGMAVPILPVLRPTVERIQEADEQGLDGEELLVG